MVAWAISSSSGATLPLDVSSDACCLSSVCNCRRSSHERFSSTPAAADEPPAGRACCASSVSHVVSRCRTCRVRRRAAALAGEQCQPARKVRDRETNRAAWPPPLRSCAAAHQPAEERTADARLAWAALRPLERAHAVGCSLFINPNHRAEDPHFLRRQHQLVDRRGRSACAPGKNVVAASPCSSARWSRAGTTPQTAESCTAVRTGCTNLPRATDLEEIEAVDRTLQHEWQCALPTNMPADLCR